MALVQLSLYSTALKRTVGLNLVLPDLGASLRTAPVLVLLHGYSGNQWDWLTGTNVAELAQRYGVVVVLPSGENHFYLDDTEKEELWSRYLVDEIPEKLSQWFGIAWHAPRAYLGGLSMGGYGALRNGLAAPHRFGGLMAFSSALITTSIASLKPGERTPYAGYDYYRRVFGDLGTLIGSDKDPEALVAALAQKADRFPRLYVACGTEDFLLAEHRSFVRCLQDWSVPHRAVETPGGHDFGFWNAQLACAVEWMSEARASWS